MSQIGHEDSRMLWAWAAAPLREEIDDVDVVAEVSTLGAYSRFQEDLRMHGFVEDVESGITVRYRHRKSALLLDVVPLDARLAGFGGRWLKPAVRAAVRRAPPSGIEVRLVPPAWLIVTKLEAFADRGNDDDCLSSRDFEDVARFQALARS